MFNLLLNVDASFTGKTNYSLFHVVTVISPETNLLFVQFENSMNDCGNYYAIILTPTIINNLKSLHVR